MLLVVTHEILQREPVVGGHEINAGIRTSTATRVEIAGAGDAIGEFSDLTAVTFPVGADGIAIAVVPLGPSDRKLAHLISAFTEVPGLGDQLDL